MTATDDKLGSNSRIKLSVIVPIRNEARFIRSTLTQLCEQLYDRDLIEIIVVDGESTDRSVEIVKETIKEHPETSIRLASNPNRLSSAARNIGISLASGDYILIIDGHVEIPSKRLFRDTAELINSTGAVILGRPQRLSTKNLTPIQKMISAARASTIGHANDSLVFSDFEGFVSPSSIAVGYKREIFERFGGFDEAFDAAEDLEFNTRLERAGLTCYTSPKLEVYYSPRESLAALFRQMQRYGIGRARLWRKHSMLPSLTAMAPPAAVGGTLLLLVLMPVVPSARVIFAALLMAYVAVCLNARRKSQALREFPMLSIIQTFTVIHAGLGIGIWRGLLRR